MFENFLARLEPFFSSDAHRPHERASLRLRVLTDYLVSQNGGGCDRDDIVAAICSELPRAAPATVACVAPRLATVSDPSGRLVSILMSLDGVAAQEALRLRSNISRISASFAATCPAEQAVVVAARDDLDAEIASVLFRRPERAIILALVKNRCVHLDRAMAAWLVGRGRHDPELARVLLGRGPLACDTAPLLLAAGKERRATVIAEARRQSLGRSPEARTRASPSLADALGVAATVGDEMAIADALAMALGFGRSDALAIVKDREGEPLALLLNLAGLSREVSSAVLSWRTGRRPDHPDVEALLQLVERTPPQAARHLIEAIVGRPLRKRSASTSRSGSDTRRPAVIVPAGQLGRSRATVTARESLSS